MAKKFNLKELPPPDFDKSLCLFQLINAHSAISELRGVMSTLQNPKLLISPLQKKEAISSSAIEGTHATMEEVLSYEDQKVKPQNIAEKKWEDIREIVNYDKAMSEAIEELKKRPIGQNLVKKVHYTLLDSVRGENKKRGHFRDDQVYIGVEGATMDQASYIPPVPAEIEDLFKNWEEYLNTDVEKDILIRIAVAHYQFEAIHPFKDGNGRIGRLLIPLFLYQVDMLPFPVLYISGYLDQYCDTYHKLLNNVDTKDEWVPWINFFLKSVETQAKHTMKAAKDIQKLYEELKVKVTTINSKYGINLLDIIFSSPIVSYNQISDKMIAKSPTTIYALLDKFVEIGILQASDLNTQRNKKFYFMDLLKILDNL